MDEFRPIGGWAASYSVWRSGLVRNNRTGRILKPSVNGPGYSQIKLPGLGGGQVTKRVHILVAAAFLPARPTPAHEVNHRDGVKANNAAGNLEWTTRPENIDHAYRHGLMRSDGEANANARLTLDDVEAIRLSSESQAALAERFGVHQSTISRIRRGKLWA